MFKDIANRPTRMAELVPLLPSAVGYHDASLDGAGGVWFPHATLNPRGVLQPSSSHQPIAWRFAWPDHIKKELVTEHNPNGTITNSDLELAGGLLHLEALAQHFDIRERTVISNTDNLASLYWQRKGSSTTNSPPAHLLRLFGIHQRFHRYVPRHDYIPGKSNPLADAMSRLFDFSDQQMLSHLTSLFQQNTSFRLVNLPSTTLSCVIFALQRRRSNVASLLVEPPVPTLTGHNGSSSQLNWASTPFSKPSRIKYLSYKSSSTEFVPELLQQKEIQSGLDRLKITYGQLPRRSCCWVKPIPASTSSKRKTYASHVC
jgi:hypothetical protein